MGKMLLPGNEKLLQSHAFLWNPLTAKTKLPYRRSQAVDKLSIHLLLSFVPFILSYLFVSFFFSLRFSFFLSFFRSHSYTATICSSVLLLHLLLYPCLLFFSPFHCSSSMNIYICKLHCFTYGTCRTL